MKEALRLFLKSEKKNSFFCYNLLSRRICEMKQKKLKSGKVVSYGFSDPEMHKALRARRHTVIADKKKQASKQICRSRSRRDQADFFVAESVVLQQSHLLEQRMIK